MRVASATRRASIPATSRSYRQCSSPESAKVGPPTRRSFGGLDSNRSLPTFEPVSVREREFRREKVWRGRRPRRHFWRHRPIPGDRDRAIPRLRRQSRGKLKTIPTAPGNRNCAGLRGGAGRTQTGNQPVMGLKGSYQGPLTDCECRHRYGTACASAVTVASCGPVPSMIAANVRGGMNASGVRRRMCLSTLPSRSAISAND